MSPLLQSLNTEEQSLSETQLGSHVLTNRFSDLAAASVLSVIPGSLEQVFGGGWGGGGGGEKG